MDFTTNIFSVTIIFILLAMGSLFSSVETATVAVSEYRLHSLKQQYLWANYAYKLKLELNQVLIFSLFGNSLANTAFTTVSTFLLVHIFHHLDEKLALPLITLIIALFIIIFSEALPKIIAARAPVTTLKIVAIPSYYLFKFTRPIVWLIDQLIIGITSVFHIKDSEGILIEDLKAIIIDKKSPFKDKHRSILLNSIEFERIPIKEVLIPLRMLEAIDISIDIEEVYNRIFTTHHTRIIVYEKTIDNIIGFIHAKDILSIYQLDQTKDNLLQKIRPITYVSDFNLIIRQIHHAQKLRSRIFVVVNEYGDTLGIACLEDMLEIVFGDFTTEAPQQKYLAIKTADNQIIVDGAMLIRELNELYDLKIQLAMDALTINGLVLKVLNGIPNSGVCFRLEDLIFEIISVGTYWVERVKILPLYNGTY